jgi:hypothetical protein
MSQGGHQQKHTAIETPDAAERPAIPGGSVGADRAWAHNRIAGFFRGQQIMRSAKAGTEEHEHAGVEVSQPH